MTNDQRPQEAPIPSTPRSWLPSFLQLRLGVLMCAIVLGIAGMSRSDNRLVIGAIVVGSVGVILRFVKPKE